MFASTSVALFTLAIPGVHTNLKLLAFKGTEIINRVRAIQVEAIPANALMSIWKTWRGDQCTIGDNP